MGQKVNPTSLRLGVNRTWDSRWYADDKYADYLHEDVKIKEFLKYMNTPWKDEIDNIEIEHIITPFIQQDEDATADRLLKLNGGKPVMSQLESIQQAGYSNDAQATLEQIQNEEAAASQSRISNIFEESSI